MSDGCVKCGDENIYQRWSRTKLCRICFEDLYAEAKIVKEELLKERREDV
jgi:ribosomal protein S14